jgi:hypothetical protein
MMIAAGSPALLEKPPYVYRLSDDIEDNARQLDAEWESLDSELADWVHDPGKLVDVGAIPPTRAIIRLARLWVQKLRYQKLRDSDQSTKAPDSVVPDNFGGIALEWNSPGVFQTLNISREGTAEIVVLQHGKFAYRTPATL